MDTKSKSTNLFRGILAWLSCLFIFFSLVTFVIYTIGSYDDIGSELISSAEQTLKTYGNALSGELRELDIYKDNASSFFERLYYSTREDIRPEPPTAAEDTAEEVEFSVERALNSRENYVESISKDNLYSITDYRFDPDGVTVTNSPNWSTDTIPNGFNYLFSFKDGVATITYLYPEDDVSVIVFSSDEPGAFYTNTLSYTLSTMVADEYPDIFFAVRSEPTSYYSANEIVSSARTYANQLIFQSSLIGVVILLYLFVLIFGIVFRRDRLQFIEFLASALRHVWIEIKLIILLFGSLMVFETLTWLPILSKSGLLAIFAAFMMIDLLFIDITNNRCIWRHNIIRSALNFFAGPKTGKPFEKIVYRKYISLVIVLLCIGVLAVLLTVIGLMEIWDFHIFVLVYCALAVAVLGALFWFSVILKDDMRDYGTLVEQISQMYNGNLSAVNHLPPTSPLYSSAMELNMIRDGIKLAVEDGVKSERTKVELITNVSHDIKTPLTSIISYVELLKAEPDLPKHVIDYIEVISQKSNRLRYMIQDIFDVSKAATGNITLHCEYLNLKVLLQQTLADMSSLVDSSAIHWRTQIPENEYPVYVDGQHIYRVFQNLIKNAAQYALEGSRVYIALVKLNGSAIFSMQNISKYELNVDGDTLTSRFVRGDDSRTTTGSGLGLSIAKSFTEACGGTFKVDVSGDLFTIEITFPLVEAPAKAADETTESDENDTIAVEQTDKADIKDTQE